MRRFLLLMMALCLTGMPAMAQVGEPPIRLLVNGHEVVSDVPPILEGGRTLVPIRALTQALGFAVSWSDADQAATLTRNGLTIVLYRDQREALVNGRAVSMDLPLVLRQGRLLVPIRFIAEQLPGVSLSWDAASRTVSLVSSAPGAAPVGVVDPAAQAIWELIRNQPKNLHATGTGSSDLGLGTPVEFEMELYTRAEEILGLFAMRMAGMEMEMGIAQYQDQIWEMQPGQGWVKANSLKEMVTQAREQVLSSPESALHGATRVEVSQGQLQGQPVTKLVVEWDGKAIADLLKLDLVESALEGSLLTTYWVSRDGFVNQLDQVMSITVEGQPMAVQIRLTMEPWEEPIPFPASITE